MTTRTPQVLAIGGGSFAAEGRPTPVERYALELTGASKPKVCFVGTATGDASNYLRLFYEAFRAPHFVPSHLALFTQPSVPDIAAHLLDQDLVYVGGGSVANLLAVWRVHGVDAAMRTAWEAGVVLTGVSAGSLCWFESGTTDSWDDELRPMPPGLGLVPGSNCPHYDSEERRRPVFHRLVGEGTIPAGYANEDGVGLHFTGTELTEVVAHPAGKQAYRVELVDGAVVETPLAARALPG
jgi:peptidase E